MSVGVPVKLMYEGLGHVVSLEVKSGCLYRGHLTNVEDNMNTLMESVTATARDGKVTHLEQVYIRGSQIRMVVFPDMLRHSPIFRQVTGKNKAKALGLGGRKRAVAMRARAGTAARGRGQER